MQTTFWNVTVEYTWQEDFEVKTARYTVYELCEWWNAFDSTNEQFTAEHPGIPTCDDAVTGWSNDIINKWETC